MAEEPDDLLEVMDLADAIVDQWADDLRLRASVILSELDERLVAATVPPKMPLTVVQECEIMSVLGLKWPHARNERITDLVRRMADLWPHLMRHGLARDYEEIAARRYDEVGAELSYEAIAAADDEADRRGVPRGRQLFQTEK